jgi:hypothetical protein
VNQKLYEFSYKPTIKVKSVKRTAEVWICATCTQCKFEFNKRGNFRCIPVIYLNHFVGEHARLWISVYKIDSVATGTDF